jgi:hypothetical protein
VKDEFKKQNDFATQVTSVSLGQAWRAMADMISGQIAGVGYDGEPRPLAPARSRGTSRGIRDQRKPHLRRPRAQPRHPRAVQPRRRPVPHPEEAPGVGHRRRRRRRRAVRDPLLENRTITATVRVTATTRDAVHDGIAQLVAKCEEAEQQPDGLPLVWTPANSTDSATFYVLSGEVGDIPVTHESGYFANSVASRSP